MQSEQLQLVFNDIRDDISLDLVNQYLDFSSQPFEKAKQEPSTRPGIYDYTIRVVSWENVLDVQSEIHKNPKGNPENQDSTSCLPRDLYHVKNPREKRFIEISDSKRKEYLKTVKGTKEETSELNINLKTLTKVFLREETPFIKITSCEEKMVYNFQGANANFKAFRDLFGVEEEVIKDEDEAKLSSKGNLKEKGIKKRLIIRKKSDRLRRICLRNYSSSKIIWEINHGKMNAFNKITLLKFIEQIRMSCVLPANFTNWKSKNSLSP